MNSQDIHMMFLVVQLTSLVIQCDWFSFHRGSQTKNCVSKHKTSLRTPQKIQVFSNPSRQRAAKKSSSSKTLFYCVFVKTPLSNISSVTNIFFLYFLTYLIEQNVFITERAIDMNHKVAIRPRRIIHDGWISRWLRHRLQGLFRHPKLLNLYTVSQTKVLCVRRLYWLFTLTHLVLM
jgi:hypothetical protein